MNKKGFTLIELLGYMTLIGTMMILFGGLMNFVSRSYDYINGRGAITNEANSMLSITMTRINSFKPQYVRECGTNCLELVIEEKREINESLGIIEYIPANEVVRIEIKDGNYYVDGLKINNSDYAVVTNVDGFTSSVLNYSCPESNSEITKTCQRPVIFLRLVIVRLNGKGEITTKPSDEAVYENRFSY